MTFKQNATDIFGKTSLLNWSLLVNIPSTLVTNTTFTNAGANTKPIINMTHTGNTLSITFGP